MLGSIPKRTSHFSFSNIRGLKIAEYMFVERYDRQRNGMQGIYVVCELFAGEDLENSSSGGGHGPADSS